MLKIGAIVGGLGLAWLFLAVFGNLSTSTPLLVVVIGLILLIAGFMRGETKNN